MENNQTLEARREAYLNFLFSTATAGNVEAGDTLSKIALGGNQRARELVKEMDQQLSSQGSMVEPQTESIPANPSERP